MKNIHQYWVYFMTNTKNTVLYIGVTNDIKRRIEEHRSKTIEGFTQKYQCNKLVYFEEFVNINDAILREKQLKNWKREWKNKLIEEFNLSWNDLYKIWENDYELEYSDYYAQSSVSDCGSSPQ